MALIDSIYRIEQQNPLFNRQSMSYDDLLRWAETLGIVVIEDRTVKCAMALKYKGTPVIIINPWDDPLIKRFALGHELGHHLLGHVENAAYHSAADGLFSKRGIEKDASIVSYLCWIPTVDICRKLFTNGRVSTEDIFNSVVNCDGDHQLLMNLLTARMRIFSAYLNVLRRRSETARIVSRQEEGLSDLTVNKLKKLQNSDNVIWEIA